MLIYPLGVPWRRLAFIFYFHLFVVLFGRHNMLFIIIKIFHWGLFCARLNSVYLCPELLGVIFTK